MKLGLGLYKHMLTPENYQFARQCGVTHIIVHLADYFKKAPTLPGQSEEGWGSTDGDRSVWTRASLARLKADINDAGLELAGIENFDPAHWYDVLLGGPKRDEQLEYLKEIIRNMGAVGIPVMGYNFSIAGVAGWSDGPFARGGATSVGFIEADARSLDPLPNGTIWNMLYDPDAPEGTVPIIDHETLWANLKVFHDAILPVAEEAGVTMAAHPDDPPMPTIRGQARLVYQPRYYDKMFADNTSPANRAELCIGSVAEMSEGDIYESVEKWAKGNRIGYVHLRNVKGKVPNYHEVFIDEGDVDIPRILSILHANHFDGTIIPDHTPQLTCDAPWHAGMAYALGYMRAEFDRLQGKERP
ncbi:mannonate dehydratase [uncultured Cohaesibacter sp.]|uniref:mannonate dehydratase n=1 Tax=uncultured Cohaesibacter sp. TaxID=1002546 RepID=UPI0029C60145|nr:mannonate dehydratase [uncultured Cohaesibacter sp.]